MKLLAFADLHGNRNALKRLVCQAEKSRPDAIVCAGDLTVFENGIHSILFTLSSLKIPVLVIPGNHESMGTLREACGHFLNVKLIHSDRFILENSCFIGYGGGGFSAIDDGFERASKKLLELSRQSQKLCLAVHAPPHGTALDWLNGHHCGNKSFRQFIEKAQPNLVVCGHFHENKGKKDYIGKTLIVNPGPEGQIIEL